MEQTSGNNNDRDFDASEEIERIIDNIETVMLGKREAVELLVLALISGGHVLIEDVPGVGKTTLASALAKSISCGFSRIQFTPDLMPSDITGFSVFNEKTGEFEFRKGAVMNDLILADEINRATARTQSALLEVMQERQVTVDGNTYSLDPPFMVIATQNPQDSFGTYPLPDSQIDRFMIKFSIGYPEHDSELEMLKLEDRGKEAIRPVTDVETIIRLQKAAKDLSVSDLIYEYIVSIDKATLEDRRLRNGAGPRAALALLAMSRSYALYQGRNYVLPGDVKYMAPYVISHRVQLKREAVSAGISRKKVIADILESVPVPESE